MKHWYNEHVETLSLDEKVADYVVRKIGSPGSIFLHTVLFIAFFVTAAAGFWSWTDMLLVLTTIVSLEAIYIGLFMQNSITRSADRDRHQADADFSTNVEAKADIEELQNAFVRLENMTKFLISTQTNRTDW